MPMTRRMNLLDYETGKVINTYGSVKELLEDLGIFRANVNEAIIKNNGKMPSKKLRFAYADGPNKPLCHYRVAQIDYDTDEIIEKYDNAELAAEDNFVNAKTIRNAIRNRGGYIKSKRLKFKYILE